MAVILVVNDDRDMLNLYSAVLKELGHEPVLGVDLDPERLVESGADAVIVDLQAEKDRLAGLRAIETLRSDPVTRAVPIVLATAATDEVRPLVERLTGLDVPVLMVPFAIDTLGDVLGQVLPSSPGPAADAP